MRRKHNIISFSLDSVSLRDVQLTTSHGWLPFLICTRIVAELLLGGCWAKFQVIYQLDSFLSSNPDSIVILLGKPDVYHQFWAFKLVKNLYNVRTRLIRESLYGWQEKNLFTHFTQHFNWKQLFPGMPRCCVIHIRISIHKLQSRATGNF